MCQIICLFEILRKLLLCYYFIYSSRYKHRDFNTNFILNSTDHKIYTHSKMLKYQQLFALIFISRINTTPECFEARNNFIFQHFRFYEQLKFHAQQS